MRRCYNCREQFRDDYLYFRTTQEGKRVRACKDCNPVKVDPKIAREDLREQMKLAILRGFRSGLLTEDETRRTLERMSST